jgi:hypothetical protein
VITTALHLSLSRARPIQSTPSHPVSPWSILMLPTHLHFGLPSGLFLFGFLTNNLYAIFPIRAKWTAYLILLFILGEEYKSRSSSLCRFLHSHITSFLIGPNIPLLILFSNSHSLCSTFNVKDPSWELHICYAFLKLLCVQSLRVETVMRSTPINWVSGHSPSSDILNKF